MPGTRAATTARSMSTRKDKASSVRDSAAVPAARMVADASGTSGATASDPARMAAGSREAYTADKPRVEDALPWYLTMGPLVAAFVIARVACCMWYSVISDCDETFNYWEPTHYMLYGSGQQTWEYDPKYALRSYAYTGLHAVLGFIGGAALGVDKIAVFHIVRILLAAAYGASEAYFISGVIARFGAGLGAWTAACMLASAGLAHAGHAFLPSSFTMNALLLAWGGWLRGDFRGYTMFIHSVAIGLVLGWPFAVVAIVPVCVHTLVLRLLTGGVAALGTLIMDAGLAVLNAVGVCVLADIAYYRRFLVAPWNIILYNAFGVGGTGAGADIYGVEPWYYYALNLMLNFPGVALIAAASPLAYVLVYHSGLVPRKLYAVPSAASAAMPTWSWALALLSQLWLWFAFMSARAHKEERFMFVVFPLIAFAAAFTLHSAVLLVSGGRSSASSNMLRGVVTMLAVLAVVVSGAAGAARIAALVDGYGAPIAAWTALARKISSPSSSLHAFAEPIRTSVLRVQHGASHVTAIDAALASVRHLVEHKTPAPSAAPGVRVCVGKEWYRFPASFFLPEQTRVSGWRSVPNFEGARGGPASLNYLKSAFTGLLPQPFLSINGSFTPQKGFNDVNREEPDRYVDPDTCDFIVDLQLPTPRHTQDAQYEPWFDTAVREESTTCNDMCLDGRGNKSRWVSVWKAPFLHSPSSPLLSRVLLIPGYSRQRNVYGVYHVLERVECNCT